MGALTSKPFSFAARSWELLDRLAFDCTDTFFSSIKVSFRGRSVMRILPDFANNLLSEWISDRARFSYDSVQNQTEHDSVYQFRLPKLSTNYLHYFFKRFPIAPYFFDIVSAYQAKSLVSFSGFSTKSVIGSSRLNFDSPLTYGFDFSRILSSAQVFKNYFFFGVNFRYQLPVFAVSLRKLLNSSEAFSFNFGYFTNNLFGDTNFGTSLSTFQNTIRGKSKVSRLYYSTSTIAFTNPFIYQLIRTYRSNSIYSFFDDPRSLSSAEVFSKLVLSPDLDSTFFCFPHFFNSNHLFPRNGKLQKFDSPIVSHESPYSFYFVSKKYAAFGLFFPSNFNFSATSYMYNNYFSHYSLPNSVSSSLNILLAVKRQTNSRSNFVYYN